MKTKPEKIKTISDFMIDFVLNRLRFRLACRKTIAWKVVWIGFDLSFCRSFRRHEFSTETSYKPANLQNKNDPATRTYFTKEYKHS